MELAVSQSKDCKTLRVEQDGQNRDLITMTTTGIEMVQKNLARKQSDEPGELVKKTMSVACDNSNTTKNDSVSWLAHLKLGKRVRDQGLFRWQGLQIEKLLVINKQQ